MTDTRRDAITVERPAVGFTPSISSLSSGSASPLSVFCLKMAASLFYQTPTTSFTSRKGDVNIERLLILVATDSYV